jgi:serine/threonine protein kinase
MENGYYTVKYDEQIHSPCLKIDGGSYTPIFTSTEPNCVIKFGVEVIQNNTIIFPYLREILIYKLMRGALNCGFSFSHKMYDCESLILMKRYYKTTFWYDFDNDELSFDNIWSIANQLVNGVHELHSNRIAHRDLKMDNIIIDKNDKNEWELRIIDYNMARLFPLNIHEVFEQPYDLCTINYRAPEYFKIPGEYKVLKTSQYFKADIWSLGCIMYYLIYKKHYVTICDKTEYYESMKIINYADARLTYESYIEELTKNYGLVESETIDVYYNTMKMCLTYDAKNRPSIYDVIDLLDVKTINNFEIQIKNYTQPNDELLFKKIKEYIDYYFLDEDLTKLFIIEQAIQYLQKYPSQDVHTVVILLLGIFTHFEQIISYNIDKKTTIHFIDNIQIYDCLVLQEIDKYEEKITSDQHDKLLTRLTLLISSNNPNNDDNSCI